MDYFAGLDISMDETHICVLDRVGRRCQTADNEPSDCAFTTFASVPGNGRFGSI
jgi:hypothetical protein